MMKRVNYSWCILLSALLACGMSACESDSVQESDNPPEVAPCPAEQHLVDGECQPNEPGDPTQDDPTQDDPTQDDPTQVDPTEGDVIGDEPGPGESEDPGVPEDPETPPGTIEDPEDPEDPIDPVTEDPVVTDPAEMLVTPLEGIVTIQNTLDASFKVSLNRAPSKDVVIPVKSSNVVAGKLSAESLTFTSDNWNNPQMITVAGSKESLPDKETDYTITVGPSQSEDTDFNELEAIDIQAKHYTVEASTQPAPVVPKSLKLDKETADLLLLGKGVTITAALDKEATDQTVYWEIVNKTDKVEYQHLVSVQYDMEKHSITLKSNVVLDSADCKAMKLDLARTLEVTAKHSSGLTATATVELKPYIALENTLTTLKKFRDFNTPGYKNTKPAEGTYEKGELGCHYYDDHTVQVLNKDMNTYYVDPYMYKVDGSNYGTRASVLGAARFLVVQFPKDVPYDSAGNSKVKPMLVTIGRYTMSTYDAAKDTADYKKRVRIFGLNLTDKAYNSFSTFTDDHVIMGGEGQDKVTPWGCEVKNTKGEDTGRNGLRCSGFVSWALRNGRFYMNDWGTVLLAQTNANFADYYQCKDSKGKYQRMFRCKERVNNNKSTGASNPNGRYESAFSKFNALKESDFVDISTLTNKSDFKAGDLLWSSTYKGCKYSSSLKHCDINTCSSGGGHVAMILGISRNADKTIKYVYVAEAIGVNGNYLNAYTIDALKKRWANSGTQKESCTSYKDTRLIKMDNVYNYAHNKNPDKVKEDLNTYKYTELWF